MEMGQMLVWRMSTRPSIRKKNQRIECEQGHFTIKPFTWKSFGSRDYFFWTPKTNVVGLMNGFLRLTRRIECDLVYRCCSGISFTRLLRFLCSVRSAILWYHFGKWDLNMGKVKQSGRVNRFLRPLTGNLHRFELYFNAVKSCSWDCLRFGHFLMNIPRAHIKIISVSWSVQKRN